MAEKFLSETLDSVSEMGLLNKEIPNYLKDNLNPAFELRSYQEEAFTRFFHCLDNHFPSAKYLKADEYLGGLSITLHGDEVYLLSNETYLAAMTELLEQIASELRQNITEYKGTETFKPNGVSFINTLIRQIFIEPKGKHLQAHEKWKEDFLEKIKEKFSGETLEFQTEKHKLIGVPFYGNQNERQFRESLESVL